MKPSLYTSIVRARNPDVVHVMVGWQVRATVRRLWPASTYCRVQNYVVRDIKERRPLKPRQAARARSYRRIYDGIDCEVSNYYSKSYLRHLMKSKEYLGLTIASIHNLAFYLWLVKQARIHIIAGDFNSWKSQMVVQLQQKA